MNDDELESVPLGLERRSEKIILHRKRFEGDEDRFNLFETVQFSPISISGEFLQDRCVHSRIERSGEQSGYVGGDDGRSGHFGDESGELLRVRDDDGDDVILERVGVDEDLGHPIPTRVSITPRRSAKGNGTHKGERA